MPTVTMRYPANMPGGPGHNWANGIAMATPIAHKGSLAGAKVQALTLLDLFLDGETVDAAWDYFNDVQMVDMEYTPFITADDKPAIFLNEGIMAQWREDVFVRPFSKRLPRDALNDLREEVVPGIRVAVLVARRKVELLLCPGHA